MNTAADTGDGDGDAVEQLGGGGAPEAGCPDARLLDPSHYRRRRRVPLRAESRESDIYVRATRKNPRGLRTLKERVHLLARQKKFPIRIYALGAC